MRREEGLGSLIARIAVTDEQTGVYTYNHFRQLLEQEFIRNKRYGHSLTLVHVHLDRDVPTGTGDEIKAGDRLLRGFAEVLSSTTRNVDIVGRRTVKEFVVCLLETDAQAANGFVERLCKKLAARSLDGFGAGDVTASIGMATCPKDSEDVRELSSFAAKAMGRAVADGGDAHWAFDPDWKKDSANRSRMH